MDNAKVLAQTLPAVATLTDSYTVPASSRAVASTLKICNQNASPTVFRVAIAVAGAADAAKQYVYYDVPIDGNDTFSATEGWTLGAGDVVRVRSGNGLCSFTLFGVELTQ